MSIIDAGLGAVHRSPAGQEQHHMACTGCHDESGDASRGCQESDSLTAVALMSRLLLKIDDVTNTHALDR